MSLLEQTKPAPGSQTEIYTRPDSSTVDRCRPGTQSIGDRPGCPRHLLKRPSGITVETSRRVATCLSSSKPERPSPRGKATARMRGQGRSPARAKAQGQQRVWHRDAAKRPRCCRRAGGGAGSVPAAAPRGQPGTGSRQLCGHPAAPPRRGDSGGSPGTAAPSPPAPRCPPRERHSPGSPRHSSRL